MSSSPHPTSGRTALLLVLGALLLTVAGTVYIFFAQYGMPPLAPQAPQTIDDAERIAAEARWFVTLLTILLTSALLILLFVVGAYLVIHAGRVVARERIGGKPTPYVDAWGQYRLTEADISAATGEDQKGKGGGPGESPPEAGPPPTEPPPRDSPERS